MQDNLGVPPPPPPGVDPVRGPRSLKWIIIGGFVLIIAAASSWIPVPIFYAFQPGPVRDVDELLETDDAQTYSSEGRLLLTTVNLNPDVTLKDWLVAIFDPATTIVLKDEVTQGGSLEDLERQGQADMSASKQHAEEVALSALGIAEPHGKGARILGTIEGSPSELVLQEDDVIVRVEGQDVGTTCDVGRAIDDADIGSEIDLTVRRDGKRMDVSVITQRNPQDRTTSFIGVYMEEIRYRFDPGFDVEIDTGQISGSSAGLMFALALYDRLTPDDLTNGLDIAGTGEIACDGGVGPIGGIELKVAGAEAQGAEVFLAPSGNAEAAEKVAGEIDVVAVSSFDDAVDYLEGLE